MNHYLLLVRERPGGVQREYVPLTDVDESADEALDRYVSNRLAGRQRNRAKAEQAIRSGITYTKLCRPSSWAIAQREAEPVTTGRRRRRKS